jgi:hypothetical protein
LADVGFVVLLVAFFAVAAAFVAACDKIVGTRATFDAGEGEPAPGSGGPVRDDASEGGVAA